MIRFVMQKEIGKFFIYIVIIYCWTSSVTAQEHYELVDGWGEYGSEEGNFIEPYGLAIDKEGNLYVSDASKTHRIQKFTSDGEFITTWGIHGTDAGEFNSPWGLAVDSEGNVYVADMWNDRIQKFTSDGDFITTWSTQSENELEFSIPRAIAVDNEDNVYVQHTSLQLTSLISGCIQKYTSDGTFIKKWDLLSGKMTYEIATDSLGNLYVPSLFSGPLQIFTPDGELLDRLNICSVIDVFCSATGVALDGENNIYISDDIHHSIAKHSPEGEVIAEWQLEHTGGFGSPPSPSGLAIDEAGYVYVVDTMNARIQKYQKVSDTNTTTITICPPGIIYGNDSEKMKLLRHFRDNLLGKTPAGQEIIRLYYEWSPSIVKAMEGDDEFTNEVKEIIDRILPMIEGTME